MQPETQSRHRTKLLLGIFLCCIVAAQLQLWFAYLRQRKDAAIQLIREFGAIVDSANAAHVEPDSVRFPSHLRLKVTDEVLRQIEPCLRDFYGLRELVLADTLITDNGLEHLSRLRSIERLYLSGAKITGKGLEWLNGLPKLRVLYLAESSITDAGLDGIEGLRVEELNLDWTGLSDLGVVKLTQLPKLRRLSLRFTAVTDAGLRHLGRNRELSFVDVSGTKVTEGGVRDLVRELPNVFCQFGHANVTRGNDGVTRDVE